jgi:hypothetical protein
VSVTPTGTLAHNVGSGGTPGGAAPGGADDVVIIAPPPIWTEVTLDMGGAGGLGTRITFTAYCPGSTPRKVNSPDAPLIVTEVSSSVAKSSPSGTRRSPTLATGPSGPRTWPDTRVAFAGRSVKSTALRSCPDLSDSVAACEADGVPGKNWVG